MSSSVSLLSFYFLKHLKMWDGKKTVWTHSIEWWCEGINEFEFSKMKKYIQWIKNYASFLFKKRTSCRTTSLSNWSLSLSFRSQPCKYTTHDSPLMWLKSLQFQCYYHLSIDTALCPHHMMSGCLAEPASLTLWCLCSWLKTS